MTESRVVDRLLREVGALSLEPQLPVAYPDVPFTPPREPAGAGGSAPLPYLVVDVVPGDSSLSAIPSTSPESWRGLLAFTVVWPAGQGAVKPVRLTDQITDHFRPGLVLVGDGVEVRVHELAARGASSREGDRLLLPLVVRWVASPTN